MTHEPPPSSSSETDEADDEMREARASFVAGFSDRVSGFHTLFDRLDEPEAAARRAPPDGRGQAAAAPLRQAGATGRLSR